MELQNQLIMEALVPEMQVLRAVLGEAKEEPEASCPK